MDGPREEILVLQTQHRDPSKRTKLALRIPSAKVGDDLAAFFALCDEREDRGYGMPISELGVFFNFFFFCFFFLLGGERRMNGLIEFLEGHGLMLSSRKALLILEAVGKFQLIGLGIGDWEALGE